MTWINKISISFVFWLVASISCWSSDTWIPPSDAHLRYEGRWDHSNPQAAVADWPGVYVKIRFQGTGCSVKLQGQNVFTATVDGEIKATFVVGDSAQIFDVAHGLENSTHVLALYKRSESQTSTASFWGFFLDSGAVLLDPPKESGRRIEFIGDSYTLGFGMESSVREADGLDEDSLVLYTTNAYAAFGPVLARSLGADYQLNAFSGKGLVRNINGIDPGKPFGYFYDYTLLSQRNTLGQSSLWNFSSWHPQVIVIGLGINDFQANPPYADSLTFDRVYSSLLDALRARHPGVRFVLCATAVWPTNALIPHIQSIVASQRTTGHLDVTYFEYGAEKTGLWWHPDVHDHAEIARQLRPLVARLGGWMTR